VSFIAFLLEVVGSVACEENGPTVKLCKSKEREGAERILVYIRTNILNQITSNKASENLGLSARQMSRIFGMTTARLISQICLKEICQLLESSRYSITDIAEIFGFSSPYALIRHFHNVAGVTPGAYRKNYGIHS